VLRRNITQSQVGIMAGPRNRPGEILLQALINLAVAAVLVAAATGVRAALTPMLGALSPFMLYVGAVLVAGLMRGAFCGGLVMLGGGIVGTRLFLSHDGVVEPGAMIAVMVFWGVSAPVLVTANELRVQLGGAMARLSAALDRKTGRAT
jgi:K+-sensing histidine kinase KdpD